MINNSDPLKLSNRSRSRPRRLLYRRNRIRCFFSTWQRIQAEAVPVVDYAAVELRLAS